MSSLGGPNQVVNGPATFTFSAAADPTFRLFECRVGGVHEWQTCSSGRQEDPASGTYTFQVVAWTGAATAPRSPRGSGRSTRSRRDDAGSERAERDVPEHAAEFAFSSNEAGTFVCMLDSVASACGSPKNYTGLRRARTRSPSRRATRPATSIPARRRGHGRSTRSLRRPSWIRAVRRGTRQTRRPPSRSPPSRAPCSTAGSTTRPSTPRARHPRPTAASRWGSTRSGCGPATRSTTPIPVRSCARGRSWPRRRRRRRASAIAGEPGLRQRGDRHDRHGADAHAHELRRRAPGRRSRQDRGEPCRGLPRRRRLLRRRDDRARRHVHGQLRFAPGAQGLRSAVLKVFSNAPGGELDVDLSGTGTAPAAPGTGPPVPPGPKVPPARPGPPETRVRWACPAPKARPVRSGRPVRPVQRVRPVPPARPGLPAPPALLAPPARRDRSARRVLPAGTRG